MEKFILLFQDLVLKAITLTENFLAQEIDEDKLAVFTDNRDRLLNVIDQISQQVEWNDVSEEQKTELSRQIDYMKKLDEKLLVKLQERQAEIREEIERTHRQKESIKGYNLNDVK